MNPDDDLCQGEIDLLNQDDGPASPSDVLFSDLDYAIRQLNIIIATTDSYHTNYLSRLALSAVQRVRDSYTLSELAPKPWEDEG